MVQQLLHEQLSQPCSKGKNERDSKNDYNSPWVRHTWLNADLWRVTHLLLQLLSCNVGSFSPTHFLAMVLQGCVHNAIKNATEICRMGTTANYAELLKNMHRSSCSINKKIDLIWYSWHFIQGVTVVLQMKKRVPWPDSLPPPFFFFQSINHSLTREV